MYVVIWWHQHTRLIHAHAYDTHVSMSAMAARGATPLSSRL